MEARIVDVSRLSKELFILTAQLLNSPGPASVHADLISDIRESLQQLDRDLCYVESFVADVEDIEIREEQRVIIARLREDYYTHKRHYRRAVLKSRDNLQAARKQQLAELTHSTKPRTPSISTIRSKRDTNASSAVLQASSDVTAELRKTHALMSEELSRSAISQELLNESSATLERLAEEYNTFGTILNGSKRLLKELENADRVDQLWIWGSFGFFCLVVSFILYRRILARPVNALIWTGSFMFSRVSQRKILQHQVDRKHSFSASSSPAQPTSPADEILDMAIPDLAQAEDDASRIERARISDDEKSCDIIHAEL